MTLLLAASDPLGRLLSQPQVLVLVIAGVIWVLKLVGRMSSSASRRDGPAAEPRRQETEADEDAARRGLEDDERARRVREDILRKIAERRVQAERVPPPPPRVQRIPRLPLEPPRATVIPVREVPAEDAYPALRAAPAVRLAPMPAPVAAAAVGPGSSPGAVWLDELRTRDSARRAILLREILGPPVALR
jgi:hypothetical protein